MTADGGRRRDPVIPDDVTGFELDRAVKGELRTLSKENAQGVGQHLVMVGRLIDSDLPLAREHADAAVRRAGRVAAVREARGLVAYREGDWALALAEFRTARRISGSNHLLPFMVDAERGLGRLERAIELAGSPEVKTLTAAEQVEMRIVVSGIRRDMDQPEAAVLSLRIPQLQPGRTEPWAARLYYAYADALLATGDESGARTWFAHAVDADADMQTDAAERIEELDGVVLIDLGDDDEAETAADDDGDAVGPVDGTGPAGESDAGVPSGGDAGVPSGGDAGVPSGGDAGVPSEVDAAASATGGTSQDGDSE